MYPALYKLDPVGRIRFWRMERGGTRYRTISGRHPEGSYDVIVSGWTPALPVGGRTAEQQAALDIEERYDHQLQRGYHASPDSLADSDVRKTSVGEADRDMIDPRRTRPELHAEQGS
ncbi:MAG: hypothetical protein LBV50_06725 [Novosphingobium sp.]|jgi:hypothetical protein|nr:hypothetical protein [Novosphingobium sp.]